MLWFALACKYFFLAVLEVEKDKMKETTSRCDEDKSFPSKGKYKCCQYQENEGVSLRKKVIITKSRVFKDQFCHCIKLAQSVQEQCSIDNWWCFWVRYFRHCCHRSVFIKISGLTPELPVAVWCQLWVGAVSPCHPIWLTSPAVFEWVIYFQIGNKPFLLGFLVMRVLTSVLKYTFFFPSSRKWNTSIRNVALNTMKYFRRTSGIGNCIFLFLVLH